MARVASTRDVIELIDAIWGSTESNIALRHSRLRTLFGNRRATVSLNQIIPMDGYFTVAADETLPTTFRNRTMSLKLIANLVMVLKSNPQALRKDLQFNQEVRGVLVDEMLDRALSIMLMTESAFSGTSHRAIFHPHWRMNESLDSFIRRVYPENRRLQCDNHTSIQCTKLSVSYFCRRHVQLKIVWTRFLSDHLILSDDNKTLHVFGYPGFLQTALEAVSPSHADSVASALRRGCLPYELLAETMWTYDIIFPYGDLPAQAWLAKRIRDNNLDNMLSQRPNNPQIHESPRDIGTPRDVSSLCRRYPYWGQRLYDLWREVNEPSPVKPPLLEFYAGVLHDWVRAQPATAWLLNIMKDFIQTIFAVLGALFGFLSWRDAAAQQIITIPKSLLSKARRMVKRKQDEYCKVDEELEKRKL